MRTISFGWRPSYHLHHIIIFFNRAILSSPDCSYFVSSSIADSGPREVNSRLFVHTTAEQTLIDRHRLHWIHCNSLADSLHRIIVLYVWVRFTNACQSMRIRWSWTCSPRRLWHSARDTADRRRLDVFDMRCQRPACVLAAAHRQQKHPWTHQATNSIIPPTTTPPALVRTSPPHAILPPCTKSLWLQP